jgi:branched-chain amino acid transport system permease protein
MGSIIGVVVGAFILILLPEYLRAFSEYRMLAFGASMVLIMVFRPQGIISGIRQRYVVRPEIEPEKGGEEDAACA